MKNLKRLLTVCIATLATTLLLSSCSGEDKIRDYEQLAGKRIVVQEGTTFDAELSTRFPSYTVIKVPTFIDIYKKLMAHEADYGIDEDVTVAAIISSGIMVDTAFANRPAVPMGAIFNKSNTQLQTQFDAFITELEKSGKLAEIRKKWFNAKNPSTLPVPTPKYTEGEPISMFSEGDYPPFSLPVGNKISGLEAELATMFADKMQRPLLIKSINFHDIITDIAAGKADFAMSAISITSERAQQVLFSKPYNYSHTIIVSIK
ncbi:MAG: transporter substrate-binding domain-containing protein [Bacteroidales bacterium]|nr:transporter substrate-binding domain-containing protein [Bacteroidales bacterium]